MSSASVLLGAGLILVGAAGPASASAGTLRTGGILGTLCPADQSLPVIGEPEGSTANIFYTTQTRPDGFVEADPQADQDNAATQFAGAGLSWMQFGGGNCVQAGANQAQVMIVNTVFLVCTLWPVRWLGGLLAIALSPLIPDLLIGPAGDLSGVLTGDLWKLWGPIAVLITMVVAAVNLVRGRGRKALGQVVWALLISAAMGGLFSQYGPEGLQWVNDEATGLTTCTMFSAAGVGCSRQQDATAVFSGGATEALATGTWAAGALGSLADSPAPNPIHITKRADPPTFGKDMDVWLPVDAIPSANPGKPTYAEVLRWGQTFTMSEVAAVKADPAKACTVSKPDVTDVNSGSYEKGTICGLKWFISAALLDDLATHHQTAFVDVTGGNIAGLFQVALNGIGTGPLALGIMVVGLMVGLYQIELIFMFLAGPVVLLIGLWHPPTVRKWAEALGGLIVRRVVVGFVLGVVMWAVGAVSSGLAKLAANPVLGLGFSVSPQAMPMTTTAVTFLALIAGWKMVGKLRDMVLVSARLPAGESTLVQNVTDKAKQYVDEALQNGQRALSMATLGTAGPIAGLVSGGLSSMRRFADNRNGGTRRSPGPAPARPGGVSPKQPSGRLGAGWLAPSAPTLSSAAADVTGTHEGKTFKEGAQKLAQAALSAATLELQVATAELNRVATSPAEEARVRAATLRNLNAGMSSDDATVAAVAGNPHRVALQNHVAELSATVRQREADLATAGDNFADKVQAALTDAARTDPRGWDSEAKHAAAVAPLFGSSQELLRAIQHMEAALRDEARNEHRRFRL